ncbi:hypothetical protein ACUY1T_21835 [Billgrantia sp. Q4P2]|uniref:hypothetical protein n=1 Tax=Billgrantia sp. Q4P2 TaxID=3463857 RepID=UPI0040566E03
MTLGREDRDTVFAEYTHTARQYGQHQQQRMERIGAEALSEMAVDSANAARIMGQLAGQALLGDAESQAILREMGQEIQAFAANPANYITESNREQLAQADALELAGHLDEADRLRVRVALENQSMLMGAGGLVASLPRLARNVVTSRSGIAGAGDFSGSRVQDGHIGPHKVSLDDAISGLRNSTGTEANQFARQIAEMSTHINQDSNRVVLGRWVENGGYIGEAKANGGVWYETDSSFFSKLTNGLSEAESRAKAWSVNEQFLQSQLERGVSRIDLHGETIREVLTNRPSSFTAMEIKYLETNAGQFGYVRDGGSWIKVD